MKCIYKLNGRIFESELALENYLLSTKKYYSKYGDVVYEMTDAQNVVNDKLTKDVLRDFVGKNGDVIECYDSNMLKNIIKIIVLTASKVKSQSANVSYNPNESQNKQVQQQIAVALAETEDWEWQDVTCIF